MPYYHVHVLHHDPSRKGRRDAYELDFSEEELMEQIVNPYLSGKTFMCGGQPIDAFFVDKISISESDEPSAKLAPKLRQRRTREVSLAGLIASTFDEYLVTRNTPNVTRKFITHAPKKEETFEKREPKQPISKNVFIVHGREQKPLKELKTMLRGFGLNPIVLHEKPSGSRTIVEKLEQYSDVGYAFVILTPDDGSFNLDKFADTVTKIELMSLSRKEKDDLFLDSFVDIMAKVARQNVVLEFGYFIGKLGRDRVCCLHKGRVELPSDMHGIVYVPFKESVSEVRDKIIRELEEVGYEIPM